MLLFMSMSLAGVLNLAPVLLGTDSEENGSSASSPVAEKIELSGFIKSGDVRGFLEGVEKYSERGGFILNETIKSSNANQDDALNLLDIFSTDDAQKVSVGFAETVANAISNGDTTLHNSTQNVSALSAYVLSSVGQDDSKSVIDSRTGFAIFEAAKERVGFHMSNLYSNVVTAKEGANKQVISSQADSLIKISRIWADFFPANNRISLFRLFFPPFLALFPVFTEISPTDVSFGPPETGWPG